MGGDIVNSQHLVLHQPLGWQPGQLGFWRLPTWLKSRAPNLDQTEFSPRVLQAVCGDTYYVLGAIPRASEHVSPRVKNRELASTDEQGKKKEPSSL